MKTISLTVPMDYNALTRAGDMLHGLALDLNKVADSVPTKATPAQGEIMPDATPALRHPNGQPDYTEAEQQFAESVAESGPGPSTTAVDDQPDAASVFGEGPGPKPTPETATTAAAPESAQPAATIAPPVATAEAPAIAQNATEQAAPAGVDLAPSVNTGVPIPWDARIHAGSKAKLAKKPHGWKMKRGVPDELVDQVEAELVAAMKASPANPVESTPEPAASTQPAPPASEPTPAAPAQPAAPTGAVTTFPALMSAITSNKIDQATVTAAVNKAGLQSLPLLAARPDLIPTVAAELGFGG